MTTKPEQHAPDGRPGTLATLMEALGALGDLDPIERARVCPELIEAAKNVLYHLRCRAMLEAVEAPGGPSQTELARRLGIHRVKVAEAIRVARDERTTTVQPAEGVSQTPGVTE